MSIPRFATSLTVASSATIFVDGTVTGSAAVTVAAGTYWLDQIYGTTVAAGSLCALSALCTAIEAEGYACDKSFTIKENCTVTLDPSSTRTIQIQPQNANTNAAGRDFLRRLGFNVVRNSPAAVATTITSGSMIGIWNPDRGESGDIDETLDAYAAATRTSGGRAYATSFGIPLYRREVTFQGLGGTHTKQRAGQSPNGTATVAFESLLWEPLVRGELVRYYADSTATSTYLTVAMTATANELTVASTTGFAAAETIWVDGELMTCINVQSGTVLEVDRYNPVAHSAYAPVSESFVATYALDNDGGNANAQGFSSKRRAHNQDRFDVVIPLVRAGGV